MEREEPIAGEGGAASSRTYGLGRCPATISTMTASSLRLRSAAAGALVAGLLGSLAFMVAVGHRNQSVILMLMFAGWVSAPFLALALLERRYLGGQAGLHRVTLTISLLSLAIYGWVAMGPPMRKPAAPFLVVPVVSWMIIGGYALARSRRGGSIP